MWWLFGLVAWVAVLFLGWCIVRGGSMKGRD